MVPNQENVEGDQTVQSQSHTAAIATTDLCAGALVLGKQELPLAVFQAINVSSQCYS